MTNFKKLFLLGAFLLFFSACNPEFNTVGLDLIANNQFETQTAEIPVYVDVEPLEKVQSDQLDIVQFGTYDFPNFGRTNANITAQLSISNNPSFGLYSQALETAGDQGNVKVIEENERLISAYLEIPFIINQNDQDFDGVIDVFDVDPSSADSDSDGDGVSDVIETEGNTNPLSNDTDGDGILDDVDEDNGSYDPDNSQKQYEVESILGDRSTSFHIRVTELTRYLSLLDPGNNFETANQYYSDQDFYEQGFVGRTLYNDTYRLNLNEVLLYYAEDDPETEDVDETTRVETRLTPRLRVPLDVDYFQEKIIDQEGEFVLADNNNFIDHIKGINIRMENANADLYMSLNFSQAAIKLNYEYSTYNDQGTIDDTNDDTIEQVEKAYNVTMSGIKINNMENIAPSPIATQANPSERIALKGGLGSRGIIRLFDHDETTQVLASFKGTEKLINEANLIFYVDPIITENWTEGDYIAERLFLYSLEDNIPLQDYFSDPVTDPSEGLGIKYIHGGILEYENGVPYRYKFRITEHVSDLVRATEDNPFENIALGVTVTNNINNLLFKNGVIAPETEILFPYAALTYPLGTILVGPSPSDELMDKRLKLEIIYTDFSN